MEKMKFNEKLMKLRKQKGMSQEEMGYKLKVTRQTISKWELGQTKPEIEKVIEIAKLFGITLDELMNENDIQYNENKNNESEKDSENGSEKAGKSKINLILIILLIIFVVLAIGFGIGFGINRIIENKKQEELQNKANEILTQGIEMVNEVQGTTNKQVNSNVVEENVKNVQEQMLQLQEQVNEQEITTQQQELLDKATKEGQQLLQQIQ